MKAFNPRVWNVKGILSSRYEPRSFRKLREFLDGQSVAIVSGVVPLGAATGSNSYSVHKDFAELTDSIAGHPRMSILLPKEVGGEALLCGLILHGPADDNGSTKGSARRIAKLSGQSAMLYRPANETSWQLVPVSLADRSFPRRSVYDLGAFDIENFIGLFGLLLSQSLGSGDGNGSVLTSDLNYLQVEHFLQYPTFFTRRIHAVYYCQDDGGEVHTDSEAEPCVRYEGTAVLVEHGQHSRSSGSELEHERPSLDDTNDGFHQRLLPLEDAGVDD